MELVLVKLGGSLITDKDKPYTARREVITQLVEQVSLIKRENPNLKLIIGNGAGSFAHQSANKYNTINGFSGDEEKLGFCLVHQDALDLNFLLAKSFLQVGLPVVSLPPISMIITHNKKLLKSDFSGIESSLQAGLIPLVFGDVVLDQAIGGTVFSTDAMLAELAKYFYLQGKFKVRLINVGNYAGVYDRAKVLNVKKNPIKTAQNMLNFGRKIKVYLFNSDYKFISQDCQRYLERTAKKRLSSIEQSSVL
ncbi:isopentenyl phosphate kinase [Nostoc punctiforme]|uniref:isopentenyl phosphate kinase n=1 Tax=Nostoc punctiforme TaxID=272131 RepID=UPI000038D64F|nr:isopentenyl phosphate kinase [Nostoc punctiforme]